MRWQPIDLANASGG
ncbi:hypothetical protein YPPY55_1812, partial [Yersinia pestis PY-55]